jgi:hypothetical protein
MRRWPISNCFNPGWGSFGTNRRDFLDWLGPNFTQYQIRVLDWNSKTAKAGPFRLLSAPPASKIRFGPAKVSLGIAINERHVVVDRTSGRRAQQAMHRGVLVSDRDMRHLPWNKVRGSQFPYLPRVRNPQHLLGTRRSAAGPIPRGGSLAIMWISDRRPRHNWRETSVPLLVASALAV